MTHKYPALRFAMALLVALNASFSGFALPVAHAAGGFTWNGSEDEDWNNPNNWNGDEAPASGDNVTINQSISHYPTITGNVTVGSITLQNGAFMNVAGGGTFTVNGGFQNEGNFTNGGTFTNMDNLTVIGPFTNDGVMENPGHVGNSGTFTNNGTIHTSGDFVNYYILENNGTIENTGFLNNNTATLNNNALGTLDLSDGTFENTGEVHNLGTVICPTDHEWNEVICAPLSYNWTGNDGTTNWNATANWAENVVPAAGHSITIPGGRTFYPVLSSSLSLKSVTIANGGSFTIAAGQTLTISSTFTNNGTFTNYGTITPTNGGVISNVGTLINNGGGVVTNAGGTFANTGTVTNNGTMNFSAGSLVNAVVFTNNGTIICPGQLIWIQTGCRVDVVSAQAASGGDTPSGGSRGSAADYNPNSTDALPSSQPNIVAPGTSGLPIEASHTVAIEPAALHTVVPELSDDPLQRVSANSIAQILGHLSGKHPAAQEHGDRAMTRGDVIALVLEEFEVPLTSARPPFRDVPRNDPHADAIATAARMKLITGYTDDAGNPLGRFGPDDTMKTYELQMLLRRLARAGFVER